MISNSSKYALKAVLYLAVNTSEEKRILAKDISGPTNVPPAYLSKLMQDLSRHKLISSTRGPGGGFYLTEENRRVTLIEIIQVIDGDHRLKSCILGLNLCDESHPCPMHHLVGETKTNFLKNLEETTIQDLVSRVKDGTSFLPL
ncbi:MAG: Rrf2 family transcriptional regulator [Maribacter sp.]